MTPIDAASPELAPPAEDAAAPADETGSTVSHIAPTQLWQTGNGAVELVQRIGAVVAAAAVLVTAYLWFAPMTVPANRGLPFGCGSPAHPNDQQLGGVVCGTTIGTHRAAAALAFAVAVLAVAVVVTLRPLGRRRWSAPVALGVLLGAPLLAAAVLQLTSEVEVRSSDGASVFNCGSALQPVQEAFARGICADVPGSRLAAGIALALGGLLVVAAVPFLWRPAAPAEPPQLVEPADPEEPEEPAT